MGSLEVKAFTYAIRGKDLGQVGLVDLNRPKVERRGLSITLDHIAPTNVGEWNSDRVVIRTGLDLVAQEHHVVQQRKEVILSGGRCDRVSKCVPPI